jgi:flagellar basal body rod protein FlgB
VIASNIARANMPNEKALDLQPLNKNFKKTLQLTTTSERHLRGKNETPGGFKVEKTKNHYETTINGNNINLSDEMKKLSDVETDNRLVTSLYAKNAHMLSTASK